MTERARWLGLAERCENATGPDEEIDWAVLSIFIDRVPPEQSWLEDPTCFRLSRRASKFTHGPLPFTASRDAVVALIEAELPGCGWCVERPPSNVTRRGKPVLPSARIIQHGYEWTYEGWPVCEAITPVLALLAAFCRAMAEKETDR